MISWELIHKYLRFEVSFEETGLEEAMKNWDISQGGLIPHHNPLLPGELINGLDKILAGDISFSAFKQWSRIACSSLVDNINEETGLLNTFSMNGKTLMIMQLNKMLLKNEWLI